MASKNNILRPGGGQSTKIYIQDLTDNEEVFIKKADGSFAETKDGKKLELPYKLHFAEKGKKKPFQSEDTFPSLTTKDWNSRFYVDKKDYVKVSSNNVLSLVFAIYCLQNNYELKVSFDINKLIDMEFDAVLVDYNDTKFIDWTRTLELNNIPVPSAADLGMPAKPASQRPAKEQSEGVDETLPPKNEFAESLGEPEVVGKKKMPWEK